MSFNEWVYEKLLQEMNELEAEQILGIRRGDPNLQAAYRKLAMQHHPDRGGDEEMMKKINIAKEILTSPPEFEPDRGPVYPPAYDSSVDRNKNRKYDFGTSADPNHADYDPRSDPKHPDYDYATDPDFEFADIDDEESSGFDFNNIDPYPRTTYYNKTA